MLKKTLLLAILMVVGFCTKAEVQAVFAELEKTTFGPLLASFLEENPSKSDMDVLMNAFDKVIKSLEDLQKDEKASYKKAKVAFNKFSEKLGSALADTVAQLSKNNHKLLDELIPNQEEIDRQTKATQKAVPEVEGWIKENEDKMTRLKADSDNQNKEIQECIDAIDQASLLISTYRGTTISLVESQRETLSNLFAKIAKSSVRIKKVAHTHLLASLSQIAMHENTSFSDQDTIGTILELLAKIRDKLVKKLAELEQSTKDGTEQIQKLKENNEKLLKQYQDQLVTLADDYKKIDGEIAAIKKVIATYEAQQIKWTEALASLNQEMDKARDIHKEEKQSFIDQIALVKKAKKLVKDETP